MKWHFTNQQKKTSSVGEFSNCNYREWPDVTCRCVRGCCFGKVLRYAKYWNATGFQGIVSIRSHCFMRGPESLSSCAVRAEFQDTSVNLLFDFCNDCFQVAVFVDYKGEA